MKFTSGLTVVKCDIPYSWNCAPTSGQKRLFASREKPRKKQSGPSHAATAFQTVSAAALDVCPIAANAEGTLSVVLRKG